MSLRGQVASGRKDRSLPAREELAGGERASGSLGTGGGRVDEVTAVTGTNVTRGVVQTYVVVADEGQVVGDA